MEKEIASDLQVKNFHTLTPAEKEKAINEKIQKGEVIVCEPVTPGPDAIPIVGAYHTYLSPLDKPVIEVSPNPDSRRPTPLDSESESEFINRVGVHEKTHVVGDPSHWDLNHNANTATPRPGADFERQPYQRETNTVRQQQNNRR